MFIFGSHCNLPLFEFMSQFSVYGITQNNVILLARLFLLQCTFHSYFYIYYNIGCAVIMVNGMNTYYFFRLVNSLNSLYQFIIFLFFMDSHTFVLQFYICFLCTSTLKWPNYNAVFEL